MQNKNAESSMTELIQLLADIAEKGYADEMDSAPTSDFIKECWDKLCVIYKDSEFRHSYSIISSCMEDYDPDQLDSLPVYLDRVIAFAETQEDSEEVRRVTKSVRKLLDHVELECVRINRMSQVKHYADEAKRAQDAAMRLNQSTKDAEERLDKRVDGFHEQSITILGIFSAVVVGFMSGMSMFTSGFNKLNEVSVYIVAFYSVIVGIILFDILFMLIFFIARISGHSIARDVPPSKNWFCSTFHRYPWVYCFHAFAVLALIVLVVLQVCFGRAVTNDQIIELVKETCSQIVYN